MLPGQAEAQRAHAASLETWRAEAAAAGEARAAGEVEAAAAMRAAGAEAAAAAAEVHGISAAEFDARCEALVRA